MQIPYVLARDPLEPRVDVRHLLLTVLPLRVAGDVAHRPGPVERDERDQVVEDRRLDLPQRLAHARRLELEHADRVALLEHRVGLLVVERELADVDVPDQCARLVDHVEVAQAEEVHLEQAERLDVVHRELRHDLLVRALLLQRHELDQRARADHDSGGVDRVLARQPLERPRQIHDLPRDRIGVVRLLERLPVLERRVERLPRPLGDQLRDPVDRAVRDLEHTPCVAHRRAGSHRPERDDLRDAVATVLLRDVVDHAVAPVDREVDVHVRHRLAPRVEEALEEQVVADRVDVGDLEAVRGERAGGAAASRADRDPVLVREADEVPDDQEVVREPHLANRLQLELQALLELGRNLLVALLEPALAQLDEVVERVAPFGRRELGQQDVPELDRDVAAIRDLERARERVLVAGEVERHLVGRLEEELVGVEAPVVRVLERVARLDAEQRLVRACVLVAEVVHVAGGDERQARLFGRAGEDRVDPGLHVEPRVLHLDVDGVGAEDVLQPRELGVRVVLAVLLERLADAPGEAARERDQPARVLLEQLPVDARLVVVALEVAEAREPDQVAVAGVVGGEERQVRVPLRLRLAVVGDVDLAADQRLDAVLAGLLDELNGARERPVVGQPDRRHLELGGPGGELGDPARPVEDRVLGVDVEMNEGRLSHRPGQSRRGPGPHPIGGTELYSGR